MPIVYIASQRGRKLLMDGGYIYTLNYEKDGLTNWRCQKRCTGTLVVDKDGNIVSRKDHSHAPDEIKCKKMEVMNNIKIKTLKSNDTATNIIISETIKLDEEIVVQLPNISSMRDNITKPRNKLLDFTPAGPQDIPDILKKDHHGEVFFRFDRGSIQFCWVL